MVYLFDFIKTEIGWIPPIPDGFQYTFLGCPQNRSFGLLEAVLPDDFPHNEKITPVDDVSREVALSGFKYPPALALTKLQINALSNISKSDFLTLFIEFLGKHLRNQLVYPFFLAEVTQKGDIELGLGGFYWIMEFFPQKSSQLHYVSDDYIIYSSAHQFFKIDVEKISKQFSYRAFLK